VRVGVTMKNSVYERAAILRASHRATATLTENSMFYAPRVGNDHPGLESHLLERFYTSGFIARARRLTHTRTENRVIQFRRGADGNSKR
jgi:hypothetical protein